MTKPAVFANGYVTGKALLEKLTNYTCWECGHSFHPGEQAGTLLRTVIPGGAVQIRVECPKCGADSKWLVAEDGP